MNIKNLTVENYLKVIYSLSKQETEFVGLKLVSEKLKIKPPSTSAMIVKLEKLNFVVYKKHGGVKLTDAGKNLALKVLRKHRLWETFLYKKLGFDWDEVHPIAEELEHVESDALMDRMEKFLGYPKRDPHGDLIPDEKGKLAKDTEFLLTELNQGDRAKLVRVKEDDTALLNYLKNNKLTIGVTFLITSKNVFDSSCSLLINEGNELFLSKEVGRVICVEKINN